MIFRDVTREKQHSKQRDNMKRQQEILTKKYQDLSLEYQTLLDVMPVYFYVEDVNDGFRHVSCNRACAELWGKTVEEVIGKSDEELFSNPDEIRVFRETDVAAATSGEIREDILPITGANGVERIGKFYRRCLSFSDGRKWLIGIVFDVTAHIERQRRIESMYHQFEYVSDLAQISPFLYELETGKVKAPEYFSKLWPLRDGKAMSIEEFVYGEDYEKVVQLYRDLAEGTISHAVFDFRSNYCHKLRYFRMKMNLEVHDGKKCFIGIIQDVTDLTNEHLYLQKPLDLQNLIINTVPVILFAKDISNDLRYVIANRNTEAILGVEEGGLLGRTDYEFRDSRLTEKATRNDRELLHEHHDGADFVESTIDPHGIKHVYKMSKKIYCGPNGEKLLLGVGSDITEQMELIENQKTLNECLSEIILSRGKDSATIILELICRRLNASRVVLLRFDYDTSTVEVENEYRAAANMCKLDSIFPFVFSRKDSWYKTLMSLRTIGISDVDTDLNRGKCGIWNMVHQQLNVKSIYESKIVVHGDLWGIFGVLYEIPNTN